MSNTTTEDSVVVEYRNGDVVACQASIDGFIVRYAEEANCSLTETACKTQRMYEASWENRARRYIDDYRRNMSGKDEALSELGISTETGEEGFVEPEKRRRSGYRTWTGLPKRNEG